MDKAEGDDHLKNPNHASDLRMSINFPGSGYHGSSHPHGYHPYHHQHPAYYQHQQSMFSSGYGHAAADSLVGNKHDANESKNPMSRDCGVPIPASKPKIWSLADTVASKTPPPHSAAFMAQQHQRQQQQQQHHQQQQLQHPMQQLQQMSSLIPGNSNNTSSSNMMSGNYNINPYTRGPSTAYENFLGVMATNNITAYSNNNNNSANSSNSNHNNHHTSNLSQQHTPTTPPTTAPPVPNSHLTPQQHQQQHLHQQQQQASTAQRGMGFPEAQPDTPPQTPPNMKVPNVQLATNLLLTATQAHMTATCHNINTNSTTNSHHHHINSRNNNIPYNLAPYSRSYDYSPRDENSSGSSCSSASSNEPEQPYKEIFKR